WGESEKIKNWLLNAKKNGPVNIYGQSLGGCMSLLAVSRVPGSIDEVHAYASPSVLGNSRDMFEEGCKGAVNKPQVNIYNNHKDIVPQAGTGYHRDWKVKKLIIEEEQCWLLAHSPIYSAYQRVVVMNIDSEKDANRTYRKVMHVFHQIFSVL